MFSQSYHVLSALLLVIIVSSLFASKTTEGYSNTETLKGSAYYSTMSKTESNLFPLALNNFRNVLQNNTSFSHDLASLVISFFNFYQTAEALYKQTPGNSPDERMKNIIISQNQQLIQLYKLGMNYGIDITVLAQSFLNKPVADLLIQFINPPSSSPPPIA